MNYFSIVFQELQYWNHIFHVPTLSEVFYKYYTKPRYLKN